VAPLSSLTAASLVAIAWFSVAGWAQTPQAGPPPPASGPLPAQPAINGVIAAGTKVEVIKGGYGALEGPMPTPDGGLYFTDIRASRIYKLDKKGDIAVWRENTAGTNGLFLAKDGRLLAVESTGHRVVAIRPDGSAMPLVTEFGGKPLRALNDLFMDKKGGIYFTDPVGQGDTPPSNILYRRPNGEVVLIDDQLVFPNGVTLTLDEKTLIANDTRSDVVYAYDVQSDGSVKNKRPFAKLLESPRSGADGLAVDSKGRLYFTSDTGVQVFDPRGQYLGLIRVPSKARNIAFGGPGRRTLYITGPTDLYRVSMLSEGPSGRPK